MNNESLKLDRRAKQLLEILAQNCRTSSATIARALHVAKDTVSYRQRQLEKLNLISQYMLFVDARRLGFTRYHLLIQLEGGISLDGQTLSMVATNPFVMWINTFIGRFDIQIIVDATDSFHLNQIREQLFLLLKNKVKHYLVLTHLSDLEFTQLNPLLDLATQFSKESDASFGKQITKRSFPVATQFEHYRAERLDIEILKVLADSPTASLTDIAGLCRCERQTVKRKILNLIAQKVILNFGAIPNLSKFGFVTYYLLVRLMQGTPISVIQKPFKELNNIFYAGRMIGEYDLILYLNARTPQELDSSIRQFRATIGSYILNYDLLVQSRVHHWRQFTKGIYEFLRDKSQAQFGIQDHRK